MRSDYRIPDQEDFRHSCDIDVRFRDLDPMGHVNNAVYLTYFEMARSSYFKALGHVPEGEEPTYQALFPFILADVTCKFLYPAKLGERLQVLIRTREMGKKNFELDYLIISLDSNNPVVFGQSIQICYDYESGSSIPVPGKLRKCIEELEGHRFLKSRPKF